MPSFVDLLRGTTGRHYLGSTGNLEARLAQHQRGHTHTTKRLGRPLTLVAARSFATREEAREVERRLKSWHNSDLAREFLSEPVASHPSVDPMADRSV
jgi:putative endonuclease